MAPEAKLRVVKRVTRSGALPVSRDAPGYTAVLGVLGVVDTCSGVGLEEGMEGGRGGRVAGQVGGEGAAPWAGDWLLLRY